MTSRICVNIARGLSRPNRAWLVTSGVIRERSRLLAKDVGNSFVRNQTCGSIGNDVWANVRQSATSTVEEEIEIDTTEIVSV